MKIKVLLIALFLSIGMMGCEDNENNEEIYPNAKIVKELPLIQMEKSVCKEGKVIIINSKNELDNLFKDDDLPESLTAIDFGKHTVILGSLGVLGKWLTTEKYNIPLPKSKTVAI